MGVGTMNSTYRADPMYKPAIERRLRDIASSGVICTALSVQH